MKNEISKILSMVEEGKIDAEKGSELISLLNSKEEASATVAPKVQKYTDKTLKIRVVSAEGDNVSVNLPIKIIKVFVEAGVNVASKIPESAQYVKDVDFNIILDAIENEIDGPIVEVKSANGDDISIVIE